MTEHSSAYRDIHSNLSSVFSSAQPVDMRIESIVSHVKKDIPDAVDTLLFLHGSSQTELSSNGSPGAIELFPAHAEARLASDPSALRELKRCEFTLEALSDHSYFPVSHVRVFQSAGQVSEFSLVFETPHVKPKAFELQGSLALADSTDDIDTDTFYWIEIDGDGNLGETLTLDATAALDIVHAACLQHNKDGVPESLLDKLDYLLEKSPSKTITKSGEYAVNGEKIIRAERSDVVTRKLGRDALKLVSFELRVQQVTPVAIEGVGVTSTLTVSQDPSDRPRVKAFYDMIVNDPHQILDRDQRTALFDERFMLYRSNPELFFDEITAAVEEAANPSSQAS